MPFVTKSLDQLQFAYRPKRSVEDAVLTLLNGVYEHLEKAATYVRIVFVDFSRSWHVYLK